MAQRPQKISAASMPGEAPSAPHPSLDIDSRPIAECRRPLRMTIDEEMLFPSSSRHANRGDQSARSGRSSRPSPRWRSGSSVEANIWFPQRLPDDGFRRPFRFCAPDDALAQSNSQSPRARKYALRRVSGRHDHARARLAMGRRRYAAIAMPEICTGAMGLAKEQPGHLVAEQGRHQIKQRRDPPHGAAAEYQRQQQEISRRSIITYAPT